jgi:hypothetical protein
MRIRWIIHYLDGKTIISDWEKEIPFYKYWSKDISSIQLQKESGKLYTLSVKKKQSGIFWQRDTEKSRSILKRLHKNIWEELTLYLDKNKPEIKIIKENIEVSNGNRE